MFKVTVKRGDKQYWYFRDRTDNAVHKGTWITEDEYIFVECLGRPRLDEDGSVVRERWPISRLEKLIWYKWCLTLRSNFGKVMPDRVNARIDKHIQEERKQAQMEDKEYLAIADSIEKKFKQMNCIYQ